MIFIGIQREDEAIEWAKGILGIEGPTGFCRALSAVDGNGDFVFVVVLSNFTPQNVDMHTAALPGATWASPKGALQAFNGIFDFAFNYMNVKRVTGLVRRRNRRARIFDEHLGFKLEGVMRQAFHDDDLCIYGFLKDEFTSHQWYRSIE